MDVLDGLWQFPATFYLLALAAALQWMVHCFSVVESVVCLVVG
jgi:hypothetical protein